MDTGKNRINYHLVGHKQDLLLDLPLRCPTCNIFLIYALHWSFWLHPCFEFYFLRLKYCYPYRYGNQQQPFHYRQLSQLQDFQFQHINFCLFIIILLHKVVILHIWEPRMKTHLKPSLTLRRDCEQTEILFLLALSYSFKYLSTYSQTAKQRSFLWNLQPFAFFFMQKEQTLGTVCCFGFRHTGIMNRERKEDSE